LCNPDFRSVPYCTVLYCTVPCTGYGTVILGCHLCTVVLCSTYSVLNSFVHCSICCCLLLRHWIALILFFKVCFKSVECYTVLLTSRHCRQVLQQKWEEILRPGTHCCGGQSPAGILLFIEYCLLLIVSNWRSNVRIQLVGVLKLISHSEFYSGCLFFHTLFDSLQCLLFLSLNNQES
jgi:hypothetical protein